MNEHERERDGSENVVVRVSVGEHEQPSIAVVRALEEASGDDATEMRPLFDVLSPESLDRLFDDTNTTVRRGTVRFPVDDFVVRVVDGTHVELRERGEKTEA
ncbi:HalOD1 output domain-containing protein [Natrarchaeobius sp. A-rgal3]|uniref:HalOD1 output domain-containing protein n=1 Tax=Natrarchaeobius versutus TaxID=1679078 RepID=UPI00351072CC